MGLSLAVAIPSLIGSLSSALASGVVLIFHIFYQTQRHFRHALIVNLLVADFLNALNNTVSGVIVLASKDRALSPGLACDLNGWLGQLTVQTVDFSIIMISIVVLLTIKKTHVAARPSAWKAAGLCVLIWVPGTITSFAALGLSFYGPVSGNWCWIKPSLPLERWLMTHTWRIAIIFSTVGVYIAVHVSLRRMYGTLNFSSGFYSTSPSRSTQIALQDRDPEEQKLWQIGDSTVSEVSNDIDSAATFSAQATADTKTLDRTGHVQVDPSSDLGRSRKREIKRILFLNGYPVVYIILWIPGLANRVVESTQGRSPLWLAALQSSTQYVGLANAVVYGWNEGMRRDIFGR